MLQSMGSQTVGLNRAAKQQYTCLLVLEPPPALLTPLGCHRAQILTPVSKPQILTAYVTYGNIYASVLLSIQRTLSFPHCGHESVVYVWISTAALQIGSSLLFFQIPYIYSKI